MSDVSTTSSNMEAHEKSHACSSELAGPVIVKMLSQRERLLLTLQMILLSQLLLLDEPRLESLNRLESITGAWILLLTRSLESLWMKARLALGLHTNGLPQRIHFVT
jgi:hypothetical protein